jgi:hypothetical protein
MGPVPVDIKDVRAGDHIVQVKAPGFQPSERHVTVTAGGSQIVKFDLNTEALADQGLLKVVSSTPEAMVFIDGAPIGKVPQEKRLSQGEHPVVVRLEGFKQFERQVRVDAGQTITVQADLKAVGRLRVLSTPVASTVLINGLAAGKTPLDTEIEVGDNVIRIEQPGFQAFEQTLTIEGGKTETLSRELAIAGPSEAENVAQQRGLSSFGARALPRGRSTVDIDGGYPYYVTGRITVGAGRIADQFSLDATVAARTMFARTELGLGGRLTVLDNNPLSLAAFTNVWWGSKLVDDSRRNGLTVDAGGIISLTALGNVTISGRAYAEFWSDRHCPALNSSTPNGLTGTDPIAICDRIKNEALLPGEESKVKRLLGVDDVNKAFDRDNGVRFVVSLVGEVALQQQVNGYLVLEGAPFEQGERALFNDLFSASMLGKDFRFYGHVGMTYKF